MHREVRPRPGRVQPETWADAEVEIMEERDKNQGRAERCHGQTGANATGNSKRRCCYREGGHEAPIGRTPPTAKQSQREPQTPPTGKTQTQTTRPMTSIRNLFRHWTPWRRNTLTSRPLWQMSQASTRQEMYCMQQLWKWPKSSFEPRKIKAVHGTIWTAPAMQ